MKQINFKEVQVETSIDVFEKHDLAKVVGDVLYKKATDLKMDELARKIYNSTGPVDIEDADFMEMMAAIEGSFYLFIRKGIENSAKDIESPN